MTAFFGVTLLGVETGLALSVVISLLLIIYESAFPHMAVLGRLPGSAAYRDIKQYPKAEQYDGIVIVQIDAPIYFANIDSIRSKLHKYEKNASEELLAHDGGDVKFIILEMSPNSHIDSSALHVLKDMLKMYKQTDVQLVLANPNRKVMEKLVASKLIDNIGQDHVFVSIQDAVKWCLDHLDTLLISVNETIEEDIEGASQCSC
jgi:sulfate transporter 4